MGKVAISELIARPVGTRIRYGGSVQVPGGHERPAWVRTALWVGLGTLAVLTRVAMQR